MFRRWALGIVAASVLAAIVAINFFAFARDGSVTLGITSYEPINIVQEKQWSESPVQVLNTFFTKGAKIAGVTGTQFERRLQLSFGNANVAEDTPPFDFRDKLGAKNFQDFERLFQNLAYRDEFPCYHDSSRTCEVGVAWNRDRTKEPGIKLYFARMTDDQYLFFDDSLIEVQQ